MIESLFGRAPHIHSHGDRNGSPRDNYDLLNKIKNGIVHVLTAARVSSVLRNK
jgi:hypothetical protein